MYSCCSWFLSVCATCFLLFFFNDTATTEIYTLSLHDALPISPAPSPRRPHGTPPAPASHPERPGLESERAEFRRSEEHTSELQSLAYLVCRLLLEKKKKRNMLTQAKTHGQYFTTDHIHAQTR